MTDNVTNELLLETLKAIQSSLSKIDGRIAHVENDIRIIKGHMAAFMQAEVQQDSAIAELTLRIERIERRLALTD